MTKSASNYKPRTTVRPVARKAKKQDRSILKLCLWMILAACVLGGSTLITNIISSSYSKASEVKSDKDLEKNKEQYTSKNKAPIGADAQIRVNNSGDQTGEDKMTAESIEQLKMDLDLQNLTATEALFSEKAIFAFETRGEKGVPPLINYLKDNRKDDKVVTAVLYTFGRVGEPAAHAVPVIIPYLSSDKPDIRGTAVSALGKIGRPSEVAIGMIKDMLFDQDKWVAERAYRALVDMRTDKSRKIAADYKHAQEMKLKAEQQMQQQNSSNNEPQAN